LCVAAETLFLDIRNIKRREVKADDEAMIVTMAKRNKKLRFMSAPLMT